MHSAVSASEQTDLGVARGQWALTSHRVGGVSTGQNEEGHGSNEAAVSLKQQLE